MKKKDIEKAEAHIKKRYTITKEVKNEINKKILKNLLIAVAIMATANILIAAPLNIKHSTLLIDLKVISVFFLLFSIVMIEYAYKKDKAPITIHTIEAIVISLFMLSLPYNFVYHLKYFPFIVYITALILDIYYAVKSIVILNLEKRKYIKSLSDIKEIVKKGDE